MRECYACFLYEREDKNPIDKDMVSLLGKYANAMLFFVALLKEGILGRNIALSLSR